MFLKDKDMGVAMVDTCNIECKKNEQTSPY